MKKLIITHFLLNLYLLALLQPGLPIVEYVVNYDYIVEQLCENKDKPILACHGKCYLQDQIVEQNNQDYEDPKPIPPKMDLEKIRSLPTQIEQESFTEDLVVINNPWSKKFIKEELFENSLLRPPQA